MDDDRTDTGAAGPAAGASATGPEAADSGTDPSAPSVEARLDPAADQAARNAEFSIFYECEMPPLVTFLAVRGAGLAAAADIAQEAMLAAYRSWDGLDWPRAWVRKTALRMWGKYRNAVRAEQPLEEVPESSGLLSPVEAGELVQRHDVLAYLRILPDAQREVMAWSYDGFQPTEIAGLLGKHPATVRSLLRQARATLQAAKATEEGTG